MGKFRKLISESFYIDLRSLALFRVSVGLVCLYDLIMAWGELRIFYTDWGVLPRQLLLQGSGYEYYLWSIHNISGVPAVINIIFILHLTVIIMLIFGFKTRFATIMVWLFTISLIARNPAVITGAYVILRLALFWAIFLPLGAKWSIDESLDINKEKSQDRVSSIASFALIFQILSIYFFAGMLKSDPIWDKEFLGVYYALSLDMFATKLGLIIREYPLITTSLTIFTVYVQRIGIIFLISPYKSSLLRIIGVIAFIFFHIGLWTTMHIGWFQAISIACLAIFIPGIFWTWVTKILSNTKRNNLTIYYDNDCAFCKRTVFIIKGLFLVGKTKMLSAQSDEKLFEIMSENNSWIVVDQYGNKRYGFEGLTYVFGCSPILFPLKYIYKIKILSKFGEFLYSTVANNRTKMSKITSFLTLKPNKTDLPYKSFLNILIVLLTVYTLTWNISSLINVEKETEEEKFYLPHSIYWIGPSFQIMQYWGLFAPYPMTDDGWVVVPGKTSTGREIDILTGNTVSWEKPEYVAGKFPNNRWRKYFSNLRRDNYEEYRRFYGRYLCREWNRDNTNGEYLETFDIYYIIERTNHPEEEPSILSPWKLWNHKCY